MDFLTASCQANQQEKYGRNPSKRWGSEIINATEWWMDESALLTVSQRPKWSGDMVDSYTFPQNLALICIMVSEKMCAAVKQWTSRCTMVISLLTVKQRNRWIILFIMKWNRTSVYNCLCHCTANCVPNLAIAVGKLSLQPQTPSISQRPWKPPTGFAHTTLGQWNLSPPHPGTYFTRICMLVYRMWLKRVMF